MTMWARRWHPSLGDDALKLGHSVSNNSVALGSGNVIVLLNLWRRCCGRGNGSGVGAGGAVVKVRPRQTLRCSRDSPAPTGMTVGAERDLAPVSWSVKREGTRKLCSF